MYAARSKSVKVYSRVAELLEEEGGQKSVIGMSTTEGRKEEGDLNGNWQEQQQTVDIGEHKIFIDRKGMTLLHFACRSGSLDVLREVIAEAKKLIGESNQFLLGFLKAADCSGRTALMLMLRQDDGRQPDVEEKLETLIFEVARRSERDDNPGKAQQEAFTEPDGPSIRHPPRTHCPSQDNDEMKPAEDSPASMDAAHGGTNSSERPRAPISDSQRQRKHDLESANNSTALMHAAHGGRNHFEKVRMKLAFLQGRQGLSLEPDGLSLDVALGLEGANHKHKTIRYGMLLKEAARGGHLDVLQHVVLAIQVWKKIQSCVLRKYSCKIHELDGPPFGPFLSRMTSSSSEYPSCQLHVRPKGT